MRYWVGLGSNLGDRLSMLRRAAEALAEHGALIARSRVFVASPVGGPPQPPFLNAAVVLDSDLEPSDFLRATQEIERTLGRDRNTEIHWGPRPIDVDILLAGTRGECIVREETLVVPHPRLHERGFALAPILDLDAALVHPHLTRPLSAFLSEVASTKDVVVATGERL